jgi:triacylglycerol lipase
MKLAPVLALLAALLLPAAAQAREPVVLVHGTFGDSSNWGYIRPQLEAAGYRTFAIDYGNRGTGDIATSARQLRDFVDHVLAVTGASKVDIVGHSQGGMMPRYYVKNLGGDSKVDDLIGLAPSNHGTSNPGALLLNGVGVCYSCGQQATGSAFLTNLNAGDETPGDVSYTVVETRYDEVVLPYTSAFLSGANTTNVRLQDRCPLDVSEHLSIIYDRVALRWIENALARKGPADPGYRPSCLPV